MGSWTPISFSNARSGESVYSAQSPHAAPVRPSWKNMPMMATMAKRPLAISADSFFFNTSGSLDVSTFHPKSPSEAAVPGFWSWLISQNEQYATICAHPSAGTLDSAARPFGTSANLIPIEGDRLPGHFRPSSGVM